jgi:hypothetical protein
MGGAILQKSASSGPLRAVEMATSILTRAIVIVAWCALSASAMAEDGPIDRDRSTGVTVAPGARTWSADNYEQKQGLINETATARGKTCSHFAFIGWPSAAGDIQEILATTRKNYETDGWSVTQTQGEISTDTIWTVRKDGREAVILWGGVMGSTIYLSCLTAGSPASDPIQTLLVGILLAIGLGCLGAGLWLIQRVRSYGVASTTWPTTQGTITASDVVPYRTQGARQFMAKVAYGYAVNGKSYTSDRIRFGAHAGAKEKAEADAAKYTVGTVVPVHYAPAQPQTSTLELGASGVSVVGVVLAGVGAAALAVVAALLLFVG